MALKLLNLGLLSVIFTAVKSYVDKAVNKVKDDIIDGAPEAYDTLKEMSDYIASHESVKDGLLTQIGSKANANDVYSKTEADSTFIAQADYTQATEAEVEALVTEIFGETE